jgi:hypothetical protein
MTLVTMACQVYLHVETMNKKELEEAIRIIKTIRIVSNN